MTPTTMSEGKYCRQIILLIERDKQINDRSVHISSFQLVITKSGILSSENAMLPTKLFGRPSCYLQFLNWFQVF